MLTNELKEKILATYRQWLYGYKKTARELGLTRDQVRKVILSTSKQRLRKRMASFNPNENKVKKTNSVYEDRDLSGYSTDAEKIAYLQDENRLLRALLIEYQKEFLPEALSSYPMFKPNNEPLCDDIPEESTTRTKKPKRSLKKKSKRHKEA